MYRGIFQSTDQIYRNYLKASQNGTVRLIADTTSSTVEGLCTDGLSACLGIVIISEDRKRISLTHTDLAVTEQAIVAECQWVGQPSRMFIARGIHYRPGSGYNCSDIFQLRTLPRIQKALADLHVTIDLTTTPIPVWGITVNRSGSITTISERSIIGITAANMELRHCINMLNGDFLTSQRSYHSLDLQYDGRGWTSPPQLDGGPLSLVRQNHSSQHVQNYDHYFNLSLTLMRNAHASATKCYAEHNYENAYPLFSQALMLAEQLQLNEHQSLKEELAIFYANLGSLYKALSNNDEATRYLEKSISIRESLFGKNCPQAQKSRDKLSEIRKTMTAKLQH